MWKTCESKWCGSAYEQAYREGYEQGWADALKPKENTADAILDKYLNERVAEVKQEGEESGS